MSETRRTVDERLYALLPAVHRIRDAAQGEPLRALLAILEHDLQALRDDTWQLYDDWFVETASEWVVPYIGDLLGVELVRGIEAEGFSARAYVANTLGYRRRKGTAAVLEQLARDVTGWPARAVEYFERLGWSQHVRHVRLHAPATLSLRGASDLELVDGPLGRECHTGEVRLVHNGRGRFDIPSVGLHLWRLRTYPLHRVDARALTQGGFALGRFHLDPLGRKGPLFNDPRAETDMVHLAEERDLPARLRRRALHAELAGIQAGGSPPEDGWLGLQPVVRVFVDGVERAWPELHICHLDLDEGEDWPRPAPGEVSLDPQTGRLALHPDDLPAEVLVDFVHAFSGDLGGGPYDRRATLGDRLDDLDDHQGVSKDQTPVAGEIIHATLAQAVDAWNLEALLAWSEDPPRSLDRVLTIMDSRTYTEDLTLATGHCILIPPNSRLRLVAARWPAELDGPVGGGERRVEGRLEPSGVRPHLLGDLEVLGLHDPTGTLGGGGLELDGLLVEGSLTVLPGSLEALSLRHCTLAPGQGGLVVEGVPGATNASLELELTRCIVDGLGLTGPVGSVTIVDSILDTGARQRVLVGSTPKPFAETVLGGVLLGAPRPEGLEIADVEQALEGLQAAVATWILSGEDLSLWGPDADVDMDTSTILGRVHLRGLEGSECLFVGQVEVRVVQQGCVRFSYVPPLSRTPRRFRCQPDLALESARAEAQDQGHTLTGAQEEAVHRRLRPLFTSISHGHPAYGQLSRSIARELYTGAEDGSEMGAFSMLQQAHREANLRGALRQYLRFGLDAGLFFVT